MLEYCWSLEEKYWLGHHADILWFLSRRRRTYDERLRYVELKISSVRVCLFVCPELWGPIARSRLKITLRDRPYLQTNQKPFPKPPSENLYLPWEAKHAAFCCCWITPHRVSIASKHGRKLDNISLGRFLPHWCCANIVSSFQGSTRDSCSPFFLKEREGLAIFCLVRNVGIELNVGGKILITTICNIFGLIEPWSSLKI